MSNGKQGRPAKYTPEFKRNAVEYYFASGKTQRECADDLGIPRKSIARWIHESGAGATDEQRAASEEVRALRREVERLEMENEFLKKAAAFFAANQG